MLVSSSSSSFARSLSLSLFLSSLLYSIHPFDCFLSASSFAEPLFFYWRQQVTYSFFLLLLQKWAALCHNGFLAVLGFRRAWDQLLRTSSPLVFLPDLARRRRLCRFSLSLTHFLMHLRYRIIWIMTRRVGRPASIGPCTHGKRSPIFPSASRDRNKERPSEDEARLRRMLRRL